MKHLKRSLALLLSAAMMLAVMPVRKRWDLTLSQAIRTISFHPDIVYKDSIENLSKILPRGKLRIFAENRPFPRQVFRRFFRPGQLHEKNLPVFSSRKAFRQPACTHTKVISSPVPNRVSFLLPA